MAGRPKISGTLLLRLLGVALMVIFKSIFLGGLLIVFSRRLSRMLNLDETLEQMWSTVKSRPRKTRSTRKLKKKADRQPEQLAPCPYCGRDIRPNIRKCPHCNHTL